MSRQVRTLLRRAAKVLVLLTERQLDSQRDQGPAPCAEYLGLGDTIADLRCLVAWRDWETLTIFLAVEELRYGLIVVDQPFSAPLPMKPPENAATSTPAKPKPKLPGINGQNYGQWKRRKIVARSVLASQLIATGRGGQP
jgi:hypothetical protein